MRILDFKHGDKIRRQSWPKGSFILITATAYERFAFELWGGALWVNRNVGLHADEIFADDWVKLD